MKAAAYDQIYANPIHAELAALGPEELSDPRVLGLSNGFLIHEDLARLLAQLGEALGARESESEGEGVLLDLGCGRGRVGRWLATQLRMKLVGVDGSAVAIGQAQASASTSERERERFMVADFAATGLATGSVAAAFSHDALYMTEDPRAALTEVHRVLRPSGVLTFTVYGSAHAAWQEHAQACGFTVVQADDLSARWREIMRAKHERRWAMREALRQRFGRRIEPELSVTASMLGLGGRSSAIEANERRSLLLRRQ